MAPAPNPNDHALVVGISRYSELPGADGTKPSILDGPVVDAQAIYDWLMDKSGGVLDEANIALILSKPASNKEPAYADVQNALTALINKTKNNRARRLYLYLSGHGFSPASDRGALLTAECDDINLPNVYASEWLDRFRELACFEEVVLWMDCCFESTDSIPIEAPPVRKGRLAGPAAPRFLGLAAQTGMRALECPIEQDGNRVHGVFTWTLLSGLRGGAPRDPATGQITAEGLQSYLLATMKTFIPPQRLAARDVSARPYVNFDAPMCFCAPNAVPKFDVSIQAAVPDGAAIVVWTGAPPRQVATAVAAGGGATVPLEPGNYVAEAGGLRAGFDVTAAAKTVTANEPIAPNSGPPVDGEYQLAVRCVNDHGSQEQGAGLTLLDSQFKRLLRSFGLLQASFAPGVYRIVAQFGADVVNKVEKIVLLDRNLIDLKIAPPALLAPAPLAGTLTHEHQQAALEGLQPNTTSWRPATRSIAAATPESAGFESFGVERGPVASPPDSAIGVLARFWTGRPPISSDPAAFPHPFEGLSIFDPAGVFHFDLSTLPRPDEPDPVASHVVDVAAGTYVLRQVFGNGAVFSRPIVASPKWQTNVVIQRDSRDVVIGRGTRDPNDPRHLTCMGSVSLHMNKLRGQQIVAEAAMDLERQTEGWRLALRDRRPLPPSEVTRLLQMKFENPVLGIIGAHLALLNEDGSVRDRGWLVEVVQNLRRMLGRAHPDVEALSQLCGPSEQSSLIPAPPMYLRSWEVIAEKVETPDPLFPPNAWWPRWRRAFDPLYMVWLERTPAAREPNAARTRPMLESVPSDR